MIARPLPPSRLGPYEVGAKIGGGGMATVYIGRSEEGEKEKLVALKVIRDELAQDENFIHMFLDEAKILSRLSHPNIIETHEFGVTDTHRFIAMELLLGRSLMEVWEALAARGQRVPVMTSAWICARVAEGLAHAHTLTDDQGQPLSVIHRDVNPSNIFLTFDGRVKLIDFGLAKMRNQRAKTGEGIVKGKVPYLSPEQIMQAEVDARSDLYSLGTTLWELGAGKRLFKRQSDIATLAAIRQADIPDLRELVPDVSDELWRIVTRSLKQKVDERYPDAATMASELDAYLSAAGDSPGPSDVAALLGRLFPGDEARQAEWLRRAKSKAPPAPTMPPPLAVPESKRFAGELAERISGIEMRSPRTAPGSPLPPPAPEPPSPISEADRRLWARLSIVFFVVYVLAALFGRP